MNTLFLGQKSIWIKVLRKWHKTAHVDDTHERDAAAPPRTHTQLKFTQDVWNRYGLYKFNVLADWQTQKKRKRPRRGFRCLFRSLYDIGNIFKRYVQSIDSFFTYRDILYDRKLSALNDCICLTWFLHIFTTFQGLRTNLELPDKRFFTTQLNSYLVFVLPQVACWSWICLQTIWNVT